MMPIYNFSFTERKLPKKGGKKQTIMLKYSKKTQQSEKQKQKQQRIQQVREQELRREQRKKKEIAQENEKRFTNLTDIMNYYRNEVKDQQLKRTQVQQDGFEFDEDDGFLNQQEAVEVMRNYQDYNFCDLIIQLPNPDNVKYIDDKQHQSITFQRAEQVFDNIIGVTSDEGFSKVQLKMERDAFLYSFLLLDDFQESQQQQQEKKKLLQLISRKQKQEDAKNEEGVENHDTNQRLDSVPRDQKNQEQENFQSTNDPQQQTPYQLFLASQLKLQNEKQKKIQEELQGAKIAALHHGEDSGNKEDSSKENTLLHQLLELDLHNTSQFKNVVQKMSGGKFMNRINLRRGMNGENGEEEKSQKKTDVHDQWAWVSNCEEPHDFHTLLRNTIIFQFTRKGDLHCRQFLSTNGESLFLVIQSNEAGIKKEAQESGQTQQIELGYADLFSLQPVDKLLRPLRLKGEVRYAVGELNKSIKGHLDFERDINRNQQPIEGRAQGLYMQAMKMSDSELWLIIAQKQREVDDIMQGVAQQLNLNLITEKSAHSIINDDPIHDRREWQTYYIYLEYIINYADRMRKLQRNALIDSEDKNRNQGSNSYDMNFAFLWKLILRKAVGDANEYAHAVHGRFSPMNFLQTLWDRLGVPCIAPYTDFFTSVKNKENLIWRRYQINEKKYRSQFLNMEKIQLTSSIILKQVNVSRLIKEEFAIAYFPVHDPYQLQGIQKAAFFQPLQKAGLLHQQQPTQTQRELRDLYDAMSDEAESTDFDSQSVKKETQFNWKIPWKLEIDTIRDYFGEKLALYFKFISFYTFHLSYMSVISLVMQVLQDNIAPERMAEANILFSIIIILWSTSFVEMWKREEVIFSVQFGQQDFEEDEAERPAFEGSYRRSIINDAMNSEFYSPFLRKIQVLFSIFLSFIVIAIVVIFVFLIFNLKVFLLNCECLPDWLGPFDANTLPNLLNSVVILVFNYIYSKIVDQLNHFENHAILSSYENSLIAQIFMFTFFSTFNSIFIVAFFSQNFQDLELCKYDIKYEANCFFQLRSQISTIFGVNFAQNLPEFLVPYLKSYLKIQQTKAATERPALHPFHQIDQFIEAQQGLDAYITNEQVDGTVSDYMELILQFCFLVLFGLPFPLCFLLAFVNNVLEIQVDKFKLIEVHRRPLPSGACNIGTWFIIIDVVTFFALLSNAGLIAYTSQNIPSGNLVWFVILLIVFLAIQYSFKFLIPSTPQIAVIINQRHQVALDNIIKGMQKGKNKCQKPSQINLNVSGITYLQDPVKQGQINTEEPLNSSHGQISQSQIK